MEGMRGATVTEVPRPDARARQAFAPPPWTGRSYAAPNLTVGSRETRRGNNREFTQGRGGDLSDTLHRPPITTLQPSPPRTQSSPAPPPPHNPEDHLVPVTQKFATRRREAPVVHCRARFRSNRQPRSGVGPETVPLPNGSRRGDCSHWMWWATICPSSSTAGRSRLG
jgi:hypothetical protein